MSTIAELIAEQDQEVDTGNSLAGLVASEREPSEPIGDPVANRQAVADGHLTDSNPSTAIDGLNVINDYEKKDPLFAESRKVGAAAVDNYLATLSPAERNSIEGSEHLDSDFPEFPGLEEDQAPFTPAGGKVVPTLGGRPDSTIPMRLNELGLTRDFFASIPEMVKQTFKLQAGGLSLAAGEQLGQDLSWRSRLGRLAEAAAGPGAGVEDAGDILPGPVRVAKELGDWASDAIAQGFGLDSSLVEGGQELRDESLERIRDLQPAEKTFMQEVITSTTQSAALALPGMFVSMITRNPAPLLAAFGVSTYGDAYGTARDAGKSPEESHRFALIDAGIEVGTEIGPAKIMLGASSSTIRKTLTRLFKSEMGGETAATIGQKVNSAMSGVETMPLDQWMGELYHELKVTWASTAILTPLQGATARLAGKAVDAVAGVQDVTGELQEITPQEQAAINQKAASAGKALKAAMFTTAGVVETDLDLSDEQIQRFIDNPELSDITDEQLDAIIGDEANEQRLISALVDRVSGVAVEVEPSFKVGDVIHELPDGTLVAGPETDGAVPGSERLATQDDIEVVPAAIGAVSFNTAADVNKKWQDQGLTFFASETDTEISLGSIIVPKDQRKQGIGSQAVQDLIDYSDQVGKTIVLTPGIEDKAHGTTSRGRLVKFYKRLGFVENKGRNKDFTLPGGSMYRIPQEAEISPASIGEISAENLIELQEADILKTERPRTFEPSQISTEELPSDISKELPPLGGGKYFHADAQSLQSWLDENGDGFLYRVTIPQSFDGGFDVGDPKYKHQFPTSEKKVHSFTSSLENAKGLIKQKPGAIVYRVLPGDVESEFTVQVHDGEKGVIHAHSPKPVHEADTIVIYANGQFEESAGEISEHRRLSEERRDLRRGDAAALARRGEGVRGAAGQRLEPFSSDQIESVPLREAVDSGLISEDEGAVIDGFLESLPESLRSNFDVVFSGQEFEPTEAQLKAHDIKSAKGFAVRGALLENIKNEARDTIVMFGGSDITTFFHEFGELAYKRLLTGDERKYVASLKSQAGSKQAPNEWFSDQLQSFMVQEKEEVFKPKLQKILSRVADTIREIWERIRVTHRTPALDELFRDVLTRNTLAEAAPLKPVDIESKEFGDWFKDSKIVNNSGEPVPLFHQTSLENVAPIERDGFNLDIVQARLGENQLPDGVYMKPSEAEIELGGEGPVGQIPLYAKITRPLRVDDREHMVRILRTDIEYEKLFEAQSKLDRENGKKFDELFKIQGEEAANLEGGEGATLKDLPITKEVDALLEEWKTQTNSNATKMRKRSTEILKERGFDGVIIAQDRGSLGRSTKTYIALQPTQVKSAVSNTGEFNPEDPSITASIGARDIPDDVKDRFIDEDLAEQYGQAYRSQLNAVVAQSDIEDFQAIASEASKLAVERTDQHFKDQEKLIRTEAKKRAEEIAANEPVSSLMDEAIAQGRIKLTDQIKADYGLTITEIINKRPGLFSRDGKVILDEFAIDEGGYQSERDFVEALANAPSKNELRETLETNFVNEDLLAIDQYRDELWQEQFFIEESQAITELLEKKKPAIRKDLKGIIRRQTGQVREEEKTVTESEALKAAFTKAAQAARAADRAGNQEGVAKEKARMKAILESAKERNQAQEARSKALDQIKKELKSTKVKKQAGKPVGKFTAEIQEIFNTLRADLKLTKVEAFNKIAQNLEDNKDNIPPYSVAIENRLLSVIAAQDAGIGRLGFARIQQQGLENILSEIKGLKGVGLSAREAQKAGPVAEINRAIEDVVDLVGGVPAGIESVDVEPGIKERVRNFIIAGPTNYIVGWKDLLDIISFKDKSSKPFQSAISKFGDVLEAKNTEKQGNLEAGEEFVSMAEESFELDDANQVRKKFNKDSIKIDLGEFINLNDTRVKLKMTKAEMRKRVMEIMDPSLHDTIFTTEGMAWTQDMADAVFDALSVQDETFVVKQLEFYQKYYESINEVYKLIYGVNLPKNINYSPISREVYKPEDNSTLSEFFSEAASRASATTAGGIKARVRSTSKLRTQADVSVFMQHVAEMEHFKAWAEKIRSLNAVFGNPQVKKAIRANFGESVDGYIDRFIINMAKGGKDTATSIKWLDKMMGRHARAVLAVKPNLTIKQLTSFVAYADAIPVTDFIKGLTINPFELKRRMNFLYDESVLVRDRWEKGSINRDLDIAARSDEYARLKLNPSFLNALLFNIKVGDMGAIVYGGYPVYKYHYNRLKEEMSEPEAKKKAISIFESISESTQQSPDISEQSMMQQGGSFAKLFTRFKSSQNQYLRKEISAVRNRTAGRSTTAEMAKTLLIFHFVLPMFFQLASDGFSFEADEDEDALFPFLPVEQKRAMILGSLNGYFIMGDMLDAWIRNILGLRNFDNDALWWDIFDDLKKAMLLLDWDDISDEDFVSGLRGVAGGSGGLSGTPIKTAYDMGTGVSDVLSGEYEEGWLKILGYSPHQAELAAERSEE